MTEINYAESDIIYINVVGTPIVVLDSWNAVNDLFEKKSHIYSSRQGRLLLYIYKALLTFLKASVHYGS